jgi:hypothetical protein
MVDTETRSSPAPQPALRESGEVREVFADDFLGLTVVGHNFKFTFVTLQADHAKEPISHERRVSARLVLPVEAVISLRDSLTRALAELKSQQMALPTHGNSKSLQ